jgi:hypothetical protein
VVPSSAMHFFQVHQLPYIFLYLFYFNRALVEFEDHYAGMVTKWWQCHPQTPNGNDKFGSCWAICSTGIWRFIGKRASNPYTNSKGVLPVEVLVVVQSTHKAYLILLSQLFLFSPTIFFTMFMMFLLLDYANPFP